MNQINCLIVDDEPVARDIVVAYCGRVSGLRIVAACGSAAEARDFLCDRVHPVHLMFLDIQMPVQTGLELLQTIQDPPQVVFTTAYREHAVDAFDLAACDYLMKPFSFERFVKAVEKARGQLFLRGTAAPGPQTGVSEEIFIRAKGEIHRIVLAEIMYAEAKGNYTQIVTQNKTLLPYITFTSVERMLPPSLFVRTHRSFIVNKSKINHIQGNRVFIMKTEIPIGNQYRQALFTSLGL